MHGLRDGSRHGPEGPASPPVLTLEAGAHEVEATVAELPGVHIRAALLDGLRRLVEALAHLGVVRLPREPVALRLQCILKLLDGSSP